MAGDWIPVTTELPRKREVVFIARITGEDRHRVIGLLIDFWLWAQQETVDGHLEGVFVDALPSTIGADVGFWNVLIDVGWLQETPTGLTIPNAEHWLTNGAKARLLKNKRQSKWRKVDGSVDGEASTGASQKASTREQKRREENTSQDGTSSQVGKSKRRSRGGLTESPEFARWYAVYPRKVHRKDAWKAYQKALADQERLGFEREVFVAKLQASVELFAQSSKGRGNKQFIPNPERWLNAGSWDDDPEDWDQAGDGPAKCRAVTRDEMKNYNPTTGIE